jgi:hypothetical protein
MLNVNSFEVSCFFRLFGSERDMAPGRSDFLDSASEPPISLGEPVPEVEAANASIRLRW